MRLLRILHGRKVYLVPFLFFSLFTFLSSCNSLPFGSEGDNSEAAAREPLEQSTDSAEEQKTEEQKTGEARTESETAEKMPPTEVSGNLDMNSERMHELLYTLPEGNSPIFLAVVPRRADREEEYEYALWEIARQGAILEQVRVSAEFLIAQTTAEFGYDEKVDVQVDNKTIEKMREKAVPLSHIRAYDSTIVRGKIKGITIPSFSINRQMNKNLPAWVLNPPVIEDHYSTVGAAQRHSEVYKSIITADKKAMVNLSRQKSLKIDNLSDQRRSNKGSSYSEVTMEVTKSKLKGFYVLARWFSPQENLYYTLAVCAKTQ